MSQCIKFLVNEPIFTTLSLIGNYSKLIRCYCKVCERYDFDSDHGHTSKVRDPALRIFDDLKAP